MEVEVDVDVDVAVGFQEDRTHTKRPIINTLYARSGPITRQCEDEPKKDEQLNTKQKGGKKGNQN